MIRIAVCDDEDMALNEIEQIIEQYAEKNTIQIEISEFYDGKELLYHIEKQQEQFDIIFLDIEMKHLDGIETAAKIRDKDRYVLLIFVTSHKKYALKAYNIHPFHFLVKPLDKDMVEKCFGEAYEFFAVEEHYYEYKQRKNICQVLIQDIMYFKSEKRTVKIYMKDGEVLSYYDKLDNVQKKLQETRLDFWRIHQSILVNARYVFRKAYDHVELKNGKILSVSEERRRELNVNYIKNVTKKMEE